ncbi:MAG: hypothetical protein EOP53_08540, partial [Sphingobacteriales bacterium]
MDIEIKRIITNEYHNGNFTIINLNNLEDFLNEKISERNYGQSVIKYSFGFELYKFDGKFAPFFSDEWESWKTKNKWFVTNAHFDWNELNHLGKEEAFELIKNRFVKSVDRIENMKRKPKDFNYKLFRNDLKLYLDEYEVLELPSNLY